MFTTSYSSSELVSFSSTSSYSKLDAPETLVPPCKGGQKTEEQSKSPAELDSSCSSLKKRGREETRRSLVLVLGRYRSKSGKCLTFSISSSRCAWPGTSPRLNDMRDENGKEKEEEGMEAEADEYEHEYELQLVGCMAEGLD
eukprot:759025-Hanusia_phi.AAC.1